MTTLDIPVIETSRLILRVPTLEDFGAWAAFCADTEATRFIGGVTDVHAAWRGMAAAAGGWTLQGFGVWSAIEKGSGRWVGRIGYVMPWGWPGTEVGYCIARDAWGAGYATEAARAAVDFAFDHLGWSEVIHTIRHDNARSQAVALRLGARPAGAVEMPPPLERCEKWVQTRSEWAARRSGAAVGRPSAPNRQASPESQSAVGNSGHTGRACFFDERNTRTTDPAGGHS